MCIHICLDFYMSIHLFVNCFIPLIDAGLAISPLVFIQSELALDCSRLHDYIHLETIFL